MKKLLAAITTITFCLTMTHAQVEQPLEDVNHVMDLT